MTLALEGVEWSAARPGRTLPPGKTRYPLYRRLGGPQGRSGQVQKISPPPGFITIAITLLNYWVPYKTGNFSISLAFISFSRNNVVLGISGYVKIIHKFLISNFRRVLNFYMFSSR
jgi:hypothetical protein